MKGVSVVVVVLLATLTLLQLGLAGYALQQRIDLFLSTPIFTHVISFVLPLSFVFVSLHQQSSSFLRATPTALLLSILSLLDAVLISICATELQPTVQQSLLKARWSTAFHEKDSALVRGIQSSLQCCGFATALDRAWPFPSKEHAADACVERFGWRRGCEGIWRESQRRVLACLVVVGVLGLLAKVCLMLVRRGRKEVIGGESVGWVPQGRRQVVEEEQQQADVGEERPELPERYRDEPVEVEDSSAQRV